MKQFDCRLKQTLEGVNTNRRLILISSILQTMQIKDSKVANIVGLDWREFCLLISFALICFSRVVMTHVSTVDNIVPRVICDN